MPEIYDSGGKPGINPSLASILFALDAAWMAECLENLSGSKTLNACETFEVGIVGPSVERLCKLWVWATALITDGSNAGERGHHRK